MREIVFDTETTGLDPAAGHRVVEIGCVELVNHVPTGATQQWYINPEREMPDDAFRIHGLSDAFLADKPVFAAIADEFLGFIDGARLIAHNAMFDLKFINAELAALHLPAWPAEQVVDSIALARERIPGAQYSLDALCRRFEIDLSRREKHGALLDAELLAEVYLELIGGRQPGLGLAADAKTRRQTGVETEVRPPRPHAPTADELLAHAAFVATLKDPLWQQ